MPTVNLPTSEAPRLRKVLEESGYEFSSLAHALWRASGPGASVAFYESGKVLVQGKEAQTVTEMLVAQRFLKAESDVSSWIGTDESGKGDYFGPLVFAGALVTAEKAALLLKAGVADCKTLSDKKAAELTPIIKEHCPHAVVVISPKRYNEMIAEMKNLNRVMGWGHARVIENILTSHTADRVISDKFGDERYIKNALSERGKKIELIQRTKAESDVAVAAASVLAREAFLRKLKESCEAFGLSFPKGASDAVIVAARAFVSAHGRERLHEIAKVHFRTTLQL
jgi:ribonuclease HIII